MTPPPEARLYVALTLAGLAEVAESGVVAPTWPRVLAQSDTEEAEYSALMTAADLSAALVTQAPQGQRRRVVVVLDQAPTESPVEHSSELIAAVHLDTDDDADPDDDLAWYAAQELSDLV